MKPAVKLTIAVALLGGAAYLVYRNRKEKKVEPEQEITLAEAREMVRQEELKQREAYTLKGNDWDGEKSFGDAIDEAMDEENYSIGISEELDIHTVREDAHEIATFNQSFVEMEDGEELTEDEIEEALDVLEQSMVDDTYGFYDDVDFDRPWAEYITEEDKILRHDPNSQKALQQYMKMELAEWMPLENNYQTLLKLFHHEFHPLNEGDKQLHGNLADRRAEFFGPKSKWTNKVTFADIILHFARSTEFHIGEDIRFWVNHLLEFNDFFDAMTDEEVETIIHEMNTHTYYHKPTNTFGLFGLTSIQINEADNIAKNSIGRQLTYNIEYNEFLKGCM